MAGAGRIPALRTQLPLATHGPASWGGGERIVDCCREGGAHKKAAPLMVKGMAQCRFRSLKCLLLKAPNIMVIMYGTHSTAEMSATLASCLICSCAEENLAAEGLPQTCPRWNMASTISGLKYLMVAEMNCTEIKVAERYQIFHERSPAVQQLPALHTHFTCTAHASIPIGGTS